MHLVPSPSCLFPSLVALFVLVPSSPSNACTGWDIELWFETRTCTEDQSIAFGIDFAADDPENYTFDWQASAGVIDGGDQATITFTCPSCDEDLDTVQLWVHIVDASDSSCWMFQEIEIDCDRDLDNEPGCRCRADTNTRASCSVGLIAFPVVILFLIRGSRRRRWRP